MTFLRKNIVARMGGVDAVAAMIGTRPSIIRKWMRCGIPEYKQDDLRLAFRLIVKTQLKRASGGATGVRQPAAPMTVDGETGGLI